MTGAFHDLKVVFISTLLTPHQIPFCDEMYKLCSEFTFIQMNNAGEEWMSKGERIRGSDHPYFQQFSPSDGFTQIIIDADAVLVGGCDLSLLLPRLKAGKPVFLYLERFYKKGINIRNFIKCIGGTYIHHGRFQKYNVNLLCTGAYCAGDAAIFHNYTGRTYKWGYFPRFEDMDSSVKKQRNQIIWVGRLIDWKHAEEAVRAVSLIVKTHPDVILKIYGDGDEKNGLIALTEELGLRDNVRIMGAIPAESVKEEMKKTGIFLSTSDYQEGWGAVLNEAMNCRCAVVASHAAGSTPFLIRHGYNGYVYKSGDISQMADYCGKLLDSHELQERFAENAYNTIKNEWSPTQAAERFLCLVEAQTAGKPFPYNSGPCSIAQAIRQDKMYDIITGESNA